MDRDYVKLICCMNRRLIQLERKVIGKDISKKSDELKSLEKSLVETDENLVCIVDYLVKLNSKLSSSDSKLRGLIDKDDIIEIVEKLENNLSKLKNNLSQDISQNVTLSSKVQELVTKHQNISSKVNNLAVNLDVNQQSISSKVNNISVELDVKQQNISSKVNNLELSHNEVSTKLNKVDEQVQKGVHLTTHELSVLKDPVTGKMVDFSITEDSDHGNIELQFGSSNSNVKLVFNENKKLSAIESDDIVVNNLAQTNKIASNVIKGSSIGSNPKPRNILECEHVLCPDWMK